MGTWQPGTDRDTRTTSTESDWLAFVIYATEGKILFETVIISIFWGRFQWENKSLHCYSLPHAKVGGGEREDNLFPQPTSGFPFSLFQVLLKTSVEGLFV